jgi:hypothetical protein
LTAKLIFEHLTKPMAFVTGPLIGLVLMAWTWNGDGVIPLYPAVVITALACVSWLAAWIMCLRIGRSLETGEPPHER